MTLHDDMTIEEKHRANEYWELSGEGEELCPFPELLHAHKWNGSDYCSICGADGRA